MKIVVIDGYAANPGDLCWDELQALGECTIYDRTCGSIGTRCWCRNLADQQNCTHR